MEYFEIARVYQFVLLYLASAIICGVASALFIYIEKRGFAQATDNVYKQCGLVPVINTLCVFLFIAGAIVGIFSFILKLLFRRKEKEDSPDFDFVPFVQPGDSMAPLPPGTQLQLIVPPPLTEQEKELIKLVEEIPIDWWKASLTYYQTNVGDVHIILQQTFNPILHGSCYPVSIIIGTDLRITSDDILPLYKKVDEYFIKLAAEKAIERIAKKPEILKEIIFKLKTNDYGQNQV